MTDKQPPSSSSAAIFVTGKIEEAAVLGHLSEVIDSFSPFWVGKFSGWRVAVLNLEEWEGLEPLRHDGTVLYDGSVRRGDRVFSAKQLLKAVHRVMSPELFLFVGSYREAGPKMRGSAVSVIRMDHEIPILPRTHADIAARSLCDPRRATRGTKVTARYHEAAFPSNDGVVPLSDTGIHAHDFQAFSSDQSVFLITCASGKSPRLGETTAAAVAIELLGECEGEDIGALHSQLLDLSPSDFERVVGAGLSGVLGIPFRQAASGRQLSGDVGGGTVRVEAKRYRTGIPANRDLLGGLDSMARTVPALSHWVVASTAELPLQAVDELALAAQERQIREVILDWPQAGIPPLAGLLTLGRAEVARQFPDLAPSLDRLAERADVLTAGEEIRATLCSMPMGRPLYNPVLPYVAGENTPRDALDARYRVVPLMHRDKEMKDWLDWARSANRTRNRLLTGDGGMGKTRLLIEVCEVLRAEGWCSGFLLEGVNGAALQRQLTSSQPILIVVDYAERRAADIDVLCEVLRSIQSKVMLVMLARNDGRWREDIVTAGGAAANALDDEDGLQILQLEPAAPVKAENAIAGRLEVFFKALHAFDFHDIIPGDQPPDFADPKYNRILLLLLEAWAIAFGEAGSRRSPVQAVLDREQRYLKKQAPPGIPQGTMMEVLAWIYYARDSAIPTRRDAHKLLKDCPSLEGQSVATISKLVDIFHDAYPGPHYLNPIQPDLIGHAVMEKYGP